MLDLISAGHTPVTTTAFNVEVGTTKASLKFTDQPTSGCDTPVKVSIMDPTGKNVITGATDSITLSLLKTNDGTMTPVAKAAVAGVATFDACTIDMAGTYRFQAALAAPALKAVSDSFVIEDTLKTITLQAVTVTPTVGNGFAVTANVLGEDGGKFTSTRQFYITSSNQSASKLESTIVKSVNGVATFTVTPKDALSYDLTVTCIPACDGSVAITGVTVAVDPSAFVVFSLPMPFFEGLSNQYYTVKLSKAPTSDVVVTISAVDASKLAPFTTSLTFTTGDFGTAQNVQVFVPNTDAAASYSGKLDHSIASNDPVYGSGVGFTGCDVTSDGQVTASIISSSDKTIMLQTHLVLDKTSEGQYTVTMNEQPGGGDGDIIIKVSNISNSMLTVDPTQVVFNFGDWTPKTFNVKVNKAPPSTAVEIAITHTIENGAGTYLSSDLKPSSHQTKVIFVEDDAGKLVVNPGGLIMRMHDTATVQVTPPIHQGAPGSAVTVSITSGDTFVTVEPSVFALNGSDFRAARQVSVFTDYKTTAPPATVTLTYTTTSTDTDWNNLSTTQTVQIVNACKKGVYTQPGGKECETFSGYQRLADTDYPTVCPKGFYNDTKSDHCTKCPAGFECSDPSVAPVACADGHYAFEGQLTCTRCRPGYACPTKDGLLIIPCWEGSYSAGGAKECTKCGAGKYCPTTKLALEIDCPDGYYSTGSAKECTACPAGHQCTDKTTAAWTACGAGKYAPMGSNACLDCPEGMQCLENGQVTVCPDGTHSPAGDSACKDCAAAKYCSLTTGLVETACPDGYYSTGNNSSCLPCMAGYFCDSTKPGELQACPAGKYNSLYGQTACQDCPTGFYTTATGSTKCEICPGGFECTSPELAPVECKLGTYAYPGSTTCAACDLGFICPAASDSPHPPGFECPIGYYCETNASFGYTVNATVQTPCEAGTYNPIIMQGAATACLPCEPGYYCPEGTGNITQFPCPPGHFCPGGLTLGTKEATENPCAAGTYLPRFGGLAAGECLPCPEGQFCPSGSGSPADCPTGSICPLGTTSGVEFKCPPGTFNDMANRWRNEDCKPCPVGHWCPEGTTTPTQCEPRTYNPSPFGHNVKNCLACPPGFACPHKAMSKASVSCKQGYYCPQGTQYMNEKPCPAGTYSDSNEIYSVQQCLQCPPGFACGAASTSETRTSCGGGHYCPEGTMDRHQYPCPAGTYIGDDHYHSEITFCLPCPAGKACEQGTTTPVDCAAGHYCPTGTQYAKQYPCPAGSYSAATDLTRDSSCTDCEEGKFCPEGSTAPQDCPVGTFNDKYRAQSRGPGSFPACQPCPGGYKCASPGTITPVACDKGKISLDQAATCSDCEAGYYCFIKGTSYKAMLSQPCPSGMFCVDTGKGISGYPTITANGCTEGYYCPEKTLTEIACPQGTFRPTKGARCLSECHAATAGWYSDTQGLASLAGKECKAGHYCPAGSTKEDEKKCPAGTYRTLKKGRSAIDCATCTAGNYCLEATETPTPCPKGHYCPRGTINPIKCPRGTYADTEGKKNSTQCTKCDAGYYCGSRGLIAATTKCKEGYLCKSGAEIPTPTDNITGSLCPAGGFCPEGASAAQACPAGTFNNFAGGTSDAACNPCTPGKYCLGSNSPEPTGDCDAGWYCEEGESSKQPVGKQAAPGEYAPAGSAAPLKCGPGTFSASAGSASCTPCTAGSYCNDHAMSTNLPECDEGHYCETGSIAPIPCPPGTFRAAKGGVDINDCTECTAGWYCNSPGLTAAEGKCAPGYYCKKKSQYKYPRTEVGGSAGPCTAGHYCLEETEDPTPCPNGTYNMSTHATKLEDCLPCWAGYYCVAGTTTPTKKCRSNYYCEIDTSVTPPKGAWEPEPSGKLCPIGSKCPEGSPKPFKCPPGEYQNLEGKATCVSCEPGKYCPPGSGDIAGNVCPAGYYCPDGTKFAKEFPCPKGTYNNLVGASKPEDCLKCPEGYYCPKEALSTFPSKCDDGYFCLKWDDNADPPTGSMSPRPIGTITGGACAAGGPRCEGGMCKVGYYCPSGSSAMTECAAGKYCGEDKLKTDSGNCQQGYYCTAKATTPVPTDGTTGNICPIGHYCIAGGTTTGGKPCPVGKYLPYTGAKADTECLKCIAGYFCDEKGMGLPTDAKKCPEGFYCPEGTSQGKANGCDIGNYCPLGSATQIKCPEGKYTNLPKQKECLPCPLGFYCKEGVSPPVVCPVGYYCPLKTVVTDGTDKIPCPAGTFNGQEGQSALSACIDCPAGNYCMEPAADRVSGRCDPGYYCKGKSITARPNNDATIGDICPKGKYCPQGSGAAKDCDPGYYCADQELEAPTGKCMAGYFCATSSNPTIPNPPAGLCQPGYFCPEGSSQQTPCPSGTYSRATGAEKLEDCLACPPGMYCSGDHLAAPEGQCDQGYYCSGGSSSKTPPTTCQKGYYCVTGSMEPKLCEEGLYTDTTKKASCDKCPEGKYCEGGNAQVACPKGYHCKSPNPTTPSTGTRQPYEFPCPGGTFSDSVGAKECTACTAGRQCKPASESDSDKCPVSKYCPLGTAYGLFCPPGKYNSDQTGLKADSECNACPAGSYCVDGRKAACQAGYWCSGGSSTPTPHLDSEKAFGELCPAGSYCEIGQVVPSKCSFGRFRKDVGALQFSDCTECPEGYYCLSGDPTPKECTEGHYCPQGTQDPKQCPLRTYNDAKKATSEVWCLACPPGYLCLEAGIADKDQSKFRCEKNSYCPKRAESSLPCPAGTSLVDPSVKRAGSWADCTPCPGGFYCPSNDGRQCDCRTGTYCPAGSIQETPCPPGHICKKNSETPVRCPKGFYCPQYDIAALYPLGGMVCKTEIEDPTVVVPVECSTNRYEVCPGGTDEPIKCGAGTKYNPEDMDCILCEPGTYNDGTTANFGTCLPCDAGHVCYEGARKKNPTIERVHRGIECPKGHYCPEGTVTPTPCPVGTYNPNEGGESESDCLDCDSNTYNEKTGQESCNICGANAECEKRSTTCNCRGKFRRFHKYDRSCRCIGGYSDESLPDVDSDDDGRADCSPKVYEECEEARTARKGNCRKKTDCSDECNGEDGEVDDDSMLCICEGTIPETVACDATCASEAPVMKLLPSGEIQLVDATNSKTTLISIADIEGMFGEISCAAEAGCGIKNVDMHQEDQGFVGRIGVGKLMAPYFEWSLDKHLKEEAEEDAGADGDTDTDSTPTTTPVTDSDTDSSTPAADSDSIPAADSDSTPAPTTRRRAQSQTVQGISNPVICLNPGETILFSIDPNLKSYPEYAKDSLLNTNSNFDYGPFMQLGISIDSGHSSITNFAHTFAEVGVYHFIDSSDESNEMIVGVQEEPCDTQYPIKTRTKDSLEAIGAKARTDFILEPSLLVIFLYLGGIMVVIFGCTICLWLYYFKEWAPQYLKGKKRLFACVKKCFSLCKSKKVAPTDNEFDEIEPFEEIDPALFADILRRLNDQYYSLQRNFESQHENGEDIRNSIMDEILRLENLLNERMRNVSPEELIRILAAQDDDSLEDLDSDHDEDEDGPFPVEDEAAQMERQLSQQMTVITEKLIEEQQAENSEANERLRLSILNDPTLAENDKEQLINDYRANLQRINDMLEGDKDKSRVALNKRLQDRAAKKRAQRGSDAGADLEPIPEVAEPLTAAPIPVPIPLDPTEEARINEEVDAERKAIAEDAGAYIAAELAELEARNKFELDQANSEEEAKRIMQRNEEEAEWLRNRLHADMANREQDLMARLEAKRKARLAKKTDDTPTPIGETPDTLQRLHEGPWNILKTFIMKKAMEDPSEDRAIKDLKEAHEQEIAKVTAEQQKQAESEKQALQDSEHKDIQQFSREKEEADANIAKQKEEERRMLREKLLITADDEERRRLEEQLQNLDTVMYSQQIKNEAALQERIRQRRRARQGREAEINRNGKEALQAVQDRQNEEMIQTTRRVETDKIETMLNEAQMAPDELADTVRSLLEQKHEKEIAGLNAQKHAKIASRQMQALQDALAEKSTRVADVRQKFKYEGLVLENERLLMSPEDFEQQQAALAARETEEINLVDFQFISGLNAMQNDILREIEDEFREKYVQVANEHMNMTYDVMRRVGSADSSLTDEFIKQAEDDLNSRITEIDVNHQAAMKGIEDREAELYAEEQEKLDEIENLKGELEALEKKKNDLTELDAKREQLELKQAEMLEKMKERGISKEEMEEMIAKHAQDMSEWERVMQEERNRQFDVLQKKIQSKIDRHAARGVEKIKQQNLQLIQKQEEESKKVRQLMFPADIEPMIYFPQRDIDTRLRIRDFQPEIAMVPDYRVASEEYDKLRALLARVIRVEEIVENVDARRFEELIGRLNTLRESIVATS